MKNLFAVTLSLILGLALNAQSPGFAINHDGSRPHPQALLELEWANAPQGFLAPRMAEADLPASPAEGLIIFQTDGDFPGYYQFVGSEWIPFQHNSFNGFASGVATGASGISYTGNNAGIVTTDGTQLITTKLNTGQVQFDLSNYTFTGTPVVVATAEYDIIDVPNICNGTWGDGVADNNHLHYFYLAPQNALNSPIIHFETDLAPSFGFNQFAFGVDRARGFEPLTLDDNPPGRFVYYDQDAPGPSNPSQWDILGDGNDRFPHPNSASWTSTGTPEVYDLTPLVAGAAYQIQIQPFFDPMVENLNPPVTAFETQVQISIDYNKDGDFSDFQESFYSFTQPTWLMPEIVDLIIPPSAVNGQTRMRVVVQRSDGDPASGQTGFNPDLGESCLTNFADNYSGHTFDFDIEITGGAPEFNFDGNFCNVSEPNQNGFIVRCYNSQGISEDVRFHFNVYDKF